MLTHSLTTPPSIHSPFSSTLHVSFSTESWWCAHATISGGWNQLFGCSLKRSTKYHEGTDSTLKPWQGEFSAQTFSFTRTPYLPLLLFAGVAIGADLNNKQMEGMVVNLQVSSLPPQHITMVPSSGLKIYGWQVSFLKAFTKVFL